jgi:hypothetical protein
MIHIFLKGTNYGFNIKARNNKITRHRYNSKDAAIEGARSEIRIIMGIFGIENEAYDAIISGSDWYVDDVKPQKRGRPRKLSKEEEDIERNEAV